MKKFKVGNIVQWSSQSWGVSKFKVGTVVAIVPAECIAQCFIPDGCKMRDAGMPRDHESYLIKQVNQKCLSWPLVKYLSPCYFQLKDLTGKRMKEINKGVLAQKAEGALIDLSSLVYSEISDSSLRGIISFCKGTTSNIRKYQKYQKDKKE